MTEESGAMWDMAIRDAEGQAEEVAKEIVLRKRRHARLLNAIRLFKQLKAEGVAWPGNERDNEPTRQPDGVRGSTGCQSTTG